MKINQAKLVKSEVDMNSSLYIHLQTLLKELFSCCSLRHIFILSSIVSLESN